MERCHYCGPTGAGLRPYGPGGSLICFPCMKATPEREQTAKQAAIALVAAAAAISPHGAVILTKNGPQPVVDLADDLGQG